MPKLTKRFVDSVAAPERGEKWIADGELRGLYLQVRPTGKSFVIKYKTRGTSRTVTIGRVGARTPDELREEARQVIAAVQRGEDPAKARAAKREALSLAEASKEYLKDAKRTLKPKSHAEYERLLNSYVLPKFGKIGVADLSTSDVAKIVRALGDRKTTANRVLATLSALFAWAAKHGHAPKGFNPAAGSEVARNREEGRERFLSVAELEKLGAVLAEGETIGLPWGIDETKAKAKNAPKPENRREKLDPFAAGAIRLLLLTGCRLGEILNLQWSHVDFERGILFLADSKTGKKAVAVGAPALRVLESLPRVGAYVIAGAKDDTPRADLKRPWARVRKAAGLEDVRIHDLRHSFASAGAGAGLALPIIGKLLGHSQSATTQRYAHLADDPLRKAAELVSSTVAERLGMRQDEKNSAIDIE
ncbi:site-specific integrase [Methylosinus sp. LW3]|uniref:site-specific integrase n=1 Tax=Methylosinus sp. LW3 TaxID=107635 RepID=UPI00046669E9|nr:site-specific integrase [Methylosinus sp. LW3]